MVIRRTVRDPTPSDIFVFAGAGASFSPPAALPLFDGLRDAILSQLGLGAFVEGAPESDPTKLMVAQALAPEPFLSDLKLGRVDIEGWLGEVLGRGSPNAVHHAVAQLAAGGARVWTVNFDRLIEQIAIGLKTVSWPDTPGSAEDLVKAHGSLGGPLIIGAEQVLTPLPSGWVDRLRTDVTDRIVIFVGYSGRDLDFQPIWNSVLENAREVLWFERPDPCDPPRVVDERRKRLLLVDIDRRGRLTFPPPVAPPEGVAATNPNPSWDFLAWCSSRRLVDVDAALVSALFDPRPMTRLPLLPGDTSWARASIAGHLGAYSTMRAEYSSLVLSRRSAEAARLLVRSFITHGGARMAALLTVAYALPPVGRLAKGREMLLRKRLTAAYRLGRHRLVLRRTRRLRADALSTWLILRSASLRLLGSLDDAATVADEALRRARLERHVVRTAHAAFQKNMALLWSERIEAATSCLQDELEPLAAVAANRWIAWSQFIAGALEVRGGDPGRALSQLRLAKERFMAEGLVDGAISTAIAALAAHRLAQDQHSFALELEQLRLLRGTAASGQLYYARHSRFTAEAIAFEEAEFARCHLSDLVTAERLYADLTRSPYPIHEALGLLGLCLLAEDPTLKRSLAGRAHDVGRNIGAHLILDRAGQVLSDPRQRSGGEIFFC
jgi:SIR2-like domain